MNLDELFRTTARQQPEHPAVIGPGAGDMLTYAQLDAIIDEQCRNLERSGVGPGHCVGLHCASGIDYLTLTYALWRSRACVVPLPVELAPGEKRQILSDIGLDALITETPEPEFAAPIERGEATAVSSRYAVRPMLCRQPGPDGFAQLNCAFIRFTSGTTGTSKGVVLSHETIRERIAAANEVLKIGPADRVVWLLSMSYHFAVSIVAYVTYGACIVLPRNLFAPAIMRAAEEHGGTLMYGSPLHFTWMKDSPQTADLSRMRLAISTTSPLDAELGLAFERKFAIPVTQALGIIELGLPCINVDFASDKPDAVGRVLPAYEMRLEETDLGGEFRELLLRGPGMLDAYYRPWRLRSEILRDGWFATGDIVTVDQAGCVRIRGRSKDVINIAGMKFFPQEAERVLESHPAIHAARVYPVQDVRFGEAAHAQVIAESGQAGKPTPAELTDWCRARLAPFKVPTAIEYVASFPKTASGKVLHLR
jgi:long-chain acyl-CoA synthetase